MTRDAKQAATERGAADEAAVERALAALRTRGAHGEVFLRTARTGTVEVKDGAIENVLARAERGLAVRVLEGDRPGFAFSSDLSPEGITTCVERAHAISRAAEPDPDLRLAGDPLEQAELDLYESGAADRPLEERAEVALAVERAARERDPRITGFRKTTYGDQEETSIIATTSGTRGSYRESSFWCSTAAIARADGEQQLGWHGEAARRFADLRPDFVGALAADRAAGKLGGQKLATQRLSAVLDPWMAIQILGAIAPLFSADNVLKRKSLFAGRIGEPVASPQVTIVDDARRPGGIRSAPFDGEGVRTRRRNLVEGGALRGYLHSLKTARKLGEPPSGNAWRGSYTAPSRIGPSNLYIEAGPDDPRDARTRLARALAITSLLNLHTIDPISGEFSLGATADYLEGGDRLYPVQGITIAGNLTDLLRSIVAVGRDLTFGPSGAGSPTLVVSEVSVGGT